MGKSRRTIGTQPRDTKMKGFGQEPIKVEGAPMHPDHFNFETVMKMRKEDILKQAKAYFDYHRRAGASEDSLRYTAYYNETI